MSDLKDYVWGMGLEHEMHVYHSPKSDKMNKNIVNFTIFNSQEALNRIIKEYNQGKIKLTELELRIIKSIPFETSGRLCNGQWVIKRVPVGMPEFVTWEPFCSIGNGRSINNLIDSIVESREMFFKILMKDSQTKELVKRYGALSDYPFGMTRYLRVPKVIGTKNEVKYKFISDKVRPEYNGSYHITMTLPYKPDINKSKFISMHKNFCNQLQWIEPLLLTAYFTGDEYAPGSSKDYVRGSYRVMIIGWGNFAGTDIRLLEKGIGRYAKTPTYWRKGFKLYESDKLKPCIPPSKSAIAENAITTLSSDIRTFGSTDPDRPYHRESGAGMTVPNGIEFRIFDHFQDKYMGNLCNLMALIAENSRVTKTTGFVYQNKVWIETLHNIMRNGYKTELSKAYIKLLREKLGLKIKTKSIIAYDVFCDIYNELITKNINGKWMKIFTKNGTGEIAKTLLIPQVNKRGWQMAFMIKANRMKIVMNKFIKLTKYLNVIKKISFKDFEKIFIKIFGSNWKRDAIDMAYFFELFGAIINKNENGTIKGIAIKKPIKILNNFNSFINEFFNKEISANINIV